MREYRNDIEKYLEGKLTPSEMHALEKAALNDPFLADALDGATQLNTADFSDDVIALNKKITARKSSSTWAWPMRIAAALLVLFVASFIIWFALDEQPQHELALEKNIPTKEETATDSVVKQHTEPLSAAPQVPVFTPPASREGKKAKTSETLKPQPQVAKDEPSIVIPSAAHREEAEAMSEVATAIAGEAADKKIATAPEQKRKAIRGFTSPTLDPAKKNEISMPQSAEMRVPETRLSSADKPAIVTGKVTSAEDGLPLPGVSVLIKGSTIGTQTDAKGRYTLPAISKNQTLIYTFIGLQPTEVSIPSNYVVADTTQVNVKMEADATALSEVVVTGYGTARKTETEESTFEYAHPVTGNREFKKYLSENLVYPQEAKDKRVEGNVVIEFTIDVNGQPGNFKTIRAIGHGCEEELIRLIQHGPKWIATHRNGTPESDQVRVRFKFELPKK